MKYKSSNRALANIKIEEAKASNSEDLITPTPQVDLIQTFIIDYCQNLNLPHLGAAQPGDAYFYSPLSIYCFGTYNAVDNHLTAYICNESKGAKGGNDVALLGVAGNSRKFPSL